MKEFRLLGYTIKRDVGEDNYNTVRLNVWRLANQYRNDFIEKFYGKFSNMDAVINNVDDFGNTYIYKIVEWGVSFLNQNKIYSYDIGRFIEEYCKEYLDPWFDATEEIEEQYNEILMTKEEAMAYRRQRKDSRGRLVGGGFGVSGAAKGMAMAGAANLATGLAHSAVNAVGNMASSISASAKKGSLYKSTKTRDTYADGLYHAMFGLHYAIAKALDDNSDCPVTYLRKGAATEADAIFSNIKKGIVPKEDIPEQLTKAISIYPYDKEVYEYIFDHYGDKEGELLVTSDYFGCSLYKRIYTELETKFVALNFLYPKTLRNSKEKFTQVCEHCGIPSKDYIDVIDNILLMHDENAKNYDAITYPDQETASKVKEELTALVNRVENISGNDEELILTIIKEIETLRCESKEKYLNYLREALNRADIRYKTVKGVLFSDRETARKARQEAAKIEELFRNCNFNTLEEIRTLRNTVAEYETDLKENFLKKLDAMIDIWQKQDSLPAQYQSFFFVKRKYFSDLYYYALGLKWESEKLGFLNENYLNWFTYMENAFMTIKGERYYSAEEANKKYYGAFAHAVSYLNYLNEKNGPKKGFLSSLKNNLSGVVVKNYESDFAFITNNGTLQMPNDTKEEGEELVRQHMKFMTDITNRANSHNSLLEQLDQPAELQEEYLSIAELVIKTPPLSSKKVEELVNSVCKYQKLSLREEGTPSDSNSSSSAGMNSCSSAAPALLESKEQSLASDTSVSRKTDIVKFTITEMRDRAAVTKALRTWMGYDLSACFKLLTELPYTMDGEYKVSDADIMRKQFEEAGATVKYTLTSDPDAPKSNLPE